MEGYYSPLRELGTKYGAATTMGLNALGVNGPQAQQGALAAYSPSPGLEYATNAAVDANDRRMASRGMLASGNNLNATGDIAGKLQYDDYNNWITRLLGQSGNELSATSGAASGLAQLGRDRAGIYTNDAGQRVNLASNVTSGLNNQATQGANAQMQGSANLIGAGLSLANLAAGGLGGMGGLSGMQGALGMSQTGRTFANGSSGAMGGVPFSIF